MVWHAVRIILLIRHMPWCDGTGDAGFSVDTASLTVDPEQETQAGLESNKPQYATEAKGSGGGKGSNQQAGTCFLLCLRPLHSCCGICACRQVE